MNILPASQEQFAAAIDLLKKNNLPTEDLHPGTQLFVLLDNNEVIGTIAAEYNFTDALLRSLSVAEEKRGKQYGESLVNFIEGYLEQQGIENIYLLTTTAASFFAKRGYEVIDRSEVSEFIQTTSEYCSVCPTSATLMKKTLNKETKLK